MATDYPEADFYGMDIAEIYPKTIKPANSYFLQDDILTCTQFEDETFDYIFVRHVYACFSVVEWDVSIESVWFAPLIVWYRETHLSFFP
jgi:hypothetical protein